MLVVTGGGAASALAYASPPDALWIPGIYDGADYDDVVDVLTDIAAVGLAPVSLRHQVRVLWRLEASGPSPAAVALRSPRPRSPPDA